MRKALAGGIFALAAAGCAGPPVAEAPGRVDPWDEARRRGIEFRALGQEPGWFLEVDEGRSMRLVYDYMERTATTVAPQRRTERDRTIYDAASQSDRLEVTVEPRVCHDGMSGFEFPDTVTVNINGRELRGCGRRLNP